MTTYAAFLRGIMPSNPNMRNEKLKHVFEVEGFTNVQTVISSGNVVFSSKIKDSTKIEINLEKALTKHLGITSAVMIRSDDQLKKILKKDPFKGAEHGSKSYLIITFLKKKPFEIFNIVDLTKTKTPDFMKTIEKQYGKEVTTRTWKTVQRIVKKMNPY